MVTIGGYAQGVTIPVIAGAALYLRYFRTDRRLAPSWFSDLWLWVAFVLISAVAIYAVINDIVPAAKSWIAPPVKTAQTERLLAPAMPSRRPSVGPPRFGRSSNGRGQH